MAKATQRKAVVDQMRVRRKGRACFENKCSTCALKIRDDDLGRLCTISDVGEHAIDVIGVLQGSLRQRSIGNGVFGLPFGLSML